MRLQHIRRSLSVVIAFVTLSYATTGRADNPPEKSRGDGNSVTEAFFQSQAAIDFYDVRVKRWSSQWAKDDSKAADYPTTSEDVVYRMLMAHSQKKCFVFIRRTTKQESTERYGGTERVFRHIFSYEDGKMLAFRPEDAVSRAMARDTDYSKFLTTTNVDYPQFLGAKPLYYANASQIESKLSDQSTPGHQLSLEVMPDGLLRVQTLVKPDYKSKSTQYFDPQTFAPKRCAIFYKKTDSWDLVYSHEMEFVERESAILPIRGNFSYESLVRSANRELKSTLANQIGTVEVEWLKFNDPKIEFPEWKKVGSSVAAFEKFLDPSQFEEEKR
ncbi:MAG: hypothetical protein SGI77_25135 [Pirellulaceae bacterium]|nr:hypothetical protein [Pirellulaceae bacterium]